MYLYNISIDCYDEYSNTIISHKKKFSHIEFIEMYNSIIDELGDGKSRKEEVVKLMVEHFKFEVPEILIEINTEYGGCRKVNNPDTHSRYDNIYTIKGN